MSATETNSKPGRKQLSDQLDRLDTILDTLADALPQAVADATREGARQAVRDVIIELVSNPELRNLIAGVTPPAPTPTAPLVTTSPAAEATGPSFWSRMKAEVAATTQAVKARCQAAAKAVTSTVRTLSTIMPLRLILIVGAVVGVAVGLISYLCPHSVSVVVGAVGAACTAVAAQVGSWLRRSARMFGLLAPA